MKKELIIFITYTFSILFFSCKENVQKSTINSNGIKTISLNSIEKSFQDNFYFKDPQIVILETTEESLISEITRMIMDDSMLFIYDKPLDKLCIFDITGKFINEIDSKGHGPKEYAQTNDFAIDTLAKQIILLCAVPEKRMYFTYQGEFVKEENNNSYFSSITADNNYIYFEKTSLRKINNQLYILNTKTNKMTEGLRKFDIKNSYYANGNSFSHGKNILYVRRYDNSIYELKNGEIIEKYQVDFKKHSFPERLMTEEETEVVDMESTTNEYVFSMSNAIENDHYLMFHTNINFFIYDKKKDVLTGYKEIVTPRWDPIINYSFSYYIPVENTTKIACLIDEPAFLKHIAKHITEHSKEKKVKEIRNKQPEVLEEILNLESKLTEDNNPLLFIYEFKD